MCDQCEAMMINGVACHETGCVNSWRHPATGKPYARACYECGCDFDPETRHHAVCIDCVESEAT